MVAITAVVAIFLMLEYLALQGHIWHKNICKVTIF